jgi:hypothetical protein
MRITCLLALLTAAACYESAWIRRFNNSQCPELCTDADDRNCLLSGEYDWRTRNFDVSLKMCSDSASWRNCFEDSENAWIRDVSQPLQGNISTARIPCIREILLESLYDAWEITMRTVYRENTITPMRLYRNTTPEYKALLESTNNKEDSVSIIIPYRFIMQYAGTRDQAANVSLQSMQTLMHLYAFKDTDWWHSFEFEKSGRHQHDVWVFLNTSSNNGQNACAAGFKRSYQDEPDYVCIGEKCGMYPPCTPDTVLAPCDNDEFRLLAGPACRPMPPAGSLCERLLQYITGAVPTSGLSPPVQRILSRIVDLQCGSSAAASTYVLVDALDSNSLEEQSLAELLGLQDTAAVPVRCCVAAVDPGPAVGVCQMCPDTGSFRRRLLAEADTEAQDLSVQWYSVNIVQTQGTDTSSAGSQVILIVLLSVAGALLLAPCIYKAFCAPKPERVHLGPARVEARPLLLYV